MSARTVTETLSMGEALCFIQDVLQQTPDRDAVLEALLAGRKVVGPLVATNGAHVVRMGLGAGRVGGMRFIDGLWHWEVDVGAFEGLGLDIPKNWPMGDVSTLIEADAAMCKVLRGLGWLCLGGGAS